MTEELIVDESGNLIDGHRRHAIENEAQEEKLIVRCKVCQEAQEAKTLVSGVCSFCQEETIIQYQIKINDLNEDRDLYEQKLKHARKSLAWASFGVTFLGMSETVHETAVSKGWWESGDRNDLELMALFHAEISEAVEGFRIGNPPSEKIPEFSLIEEELADCIIRIMDYSAQRGFDVGAAIVEKAKYNTGREYRHGNKAA